jgi:hypothetical protein
MINLIIQMLMTDKFYGKGECIEIAKGKYAIPFTIKKAIEKGRRQAHIKNLKNNG